MNPFQVARLVVLVATILLGMDSNRVFAQTEEEAPLVPQNLLKLIHTPEVQQELGLEDDPRLLTVLRDIDRTWWPSRLLPAAKQIETTRELEKRLLHALTQQLTPQKTRRLREIEIQSQGTRALLRADVSEAVELGPQELRTIRTEFLATDSLARQFSEKTGGDADLEKQLRAAREKEQKVVDRLLSYSQRQSLAKLLGEPLNFRNLKRIYPLAPELIDSDEWAGTGRTTLEAQRGKVVLLHFYAFQCHNCVANFEHYNRWQESLSKKGVAVIGIQTPETSAERDSKLVQRAAKEQGFEFPVLIDLKNSNWDAWGNTMWPTVYVVDKKGYIRYWWQGELNWQGATGDQTIEKMVNALLTE
ncbi:MAG: redoxin domain-containing protein [Planctomyces sp.]|jgi:peroxiredoxin